MHERQVEQLRADLIHVDAALRLFDPGNEPGDIEALRRFPRRTEYFARGEVTRMVYEALRASPEVRAQDIAEQAMRDKGLPETDRAQRREFVNRFLNVHARHEAAREAGEDRQRAGRAVRFG